MRHLYDIILQFREYVLLVTCIAVSVFLLSLNDTPQIRAIRTLTIGAVAYIQDALDFIPNYFNLRRENRVLRDLNLMLSEEVSRLREARLENLRLRRLLELKDREPFEYVAARVVGKHLQPFRNTITIDVGEADGVAVNMPLVNEFGLVGKVIGTSRSHAIGEMILNRDFRVSARVQRSRADGIVMWEGGDRLILKNVAKTLDIRVGDLIITSEHSSIFPPGIRIGLVSSTEETPGSLFQEVEIDAGVDFGALNEVFVIKTTPDSSRVLLEQQLGG